MDVFFLSSKIEVFPISLLEAMSVGLICVAPNIGGIKEIIKDDINGILYYSREADVLSKKIISVASRKDLGEKARTHVVDNYSNPKELSNIYRSIYDKLYI
jgi:glycosyltransferase involved in cell wall biosynthesis